MYGKIHESIFKGTLVNDLGWLGVYVFSSMIVLADKDGIVSMDERSLFKTLALNEDEDKEDLWNKFMKTLEQLCSPDDLSNKKESEGRRLIPLREIPELNDNRGWFIVNYNHYRRQGSTDERNEYARGYMAAMRKLTNKGNDSNNVSNVRNVKNPLAEISKIRHTDTDTDTDIKRSGSSMNKPSEAQAACVINEVVPASGDPLLPLDNINPLPLLKTKKARTQRVAMLSEVDPDVKKVFKAYCDSWSRNENQYTLTKERTKWIELVLKQYGLEGALLGVENFRLDDFENRGKYNDIEYLFGGKEAVRQKRVDRYCVPRVITNTPSFQKVIKNQQDTKDTFEIARRMAREMERKE